MDLLTIMKMSAFRTAHLDTLLLDSLAIAKCLDGMRELSTTFITLVCRTTLKDAQPSELVGTQIAKKTTKPKALIVIRHALKE